MRGSFENEKEEKYGTMVGEVVSNLSVPKTFWQSYWLIADGSVHIFHLFIQVERRGYPATSALFLSIYIH